MESKQQTRAQKDLEEKLALEEPFSRELAALFALIVKEFSTYVAKNGISPGSEKYMTEFMQVLRKHYARVQKRFKGTVAEMNEINLDQDLSEDIDYNLLTWSDATAPVQATYITATNSSNMQESINMAERIISENGDIITNRTLAATAPIFLRRLFKGRISGISVYETQNTAEATKNIEANAISRDFIRKQKKQWRTVGDIFVRETHNRANGQRVDIDKPFIVGEARLKYPGDTSLGAPIKEVAHCRCSSVYELR